MANMATDQFMMQQPIHQQNSSTFAVLSSTNTAYSQQQQQQHQIGGVGYQAMFPGTHQQQPQQQPGFLFPQPQDHHFNQGFMTPAYNQTHSYGHSYWPPVVPGASVKMEHTSFQPVVEPGPANRRRNSRGGSTGVGGSNRKRPLASNDQFNNLTSQRISPTDQKKPTVQQAKTRRSRKVPIQQQQQQQQQQQPSFIADVKPTTLTTPVNFQTPSVPSQSPSSFIDCNGQQRVLANVR